MKRRIGFVAVAAMVTSLTFLAPVFAQSTCTQTQIKSKTQTRIKNGTQTQTKSGKTIMNQTGTKSQTGR